MIFRERNGKFEGVLKGGKIIEFDDAAEMKACVAKRRELLRLLGKKQQNILRVRKKRKTPIEKKTVRIYIDPDVEYLGNEKALA